MTSQKLIPVYWLDEGLNHHLRRLHDCLKNDFGIHQQINVMSKLQGEIALGRSISLRCSLQKRDKRIFGTKCRVNQNHMASIMMNQSRYMSSNQSTMGSRRTNKVLVKNTKQEQPTNKNEHLVLNVTIEVPLTSDESGTTCGKDLVCKAFIESVPKSATPNISRPNATKLDKVMFNLFSSLLQQSNATIKIPEPKYCHVNKHVSNPLQNEDHKLVHSKLKTSASTTKHEEDSIEDNPKTCTSFQEEQTEENGSIKTSNPSLKLDFINENLARCRQEYYYIKMLIINKLMKQYLTEICSDTEITKTNKSKEPINNFDEPSCKSEVMSKKNDVSVETNKTFGSIEKDCQKTKSIVQPSTLKPIYYKEYSETEDVYRQVGLPLTELGPDKKKHDNQIVKHSKAVDDNEGRNAQCIMHNMSGNKKPYVETIKCHDILIGKPITDVCNNEMKNTNKSIDEKINQRSEKNLFESTADIQNNLRRKTFINVNSLEPNEEVEIEFQPHEETPEINIVVDTVGLQNEDTEKWTPVKNSQKSEINNNKNLKGSLFAFSDTNSNYKPLSSQVPNTVNKLTNKYSEAVSFSTKDNVKDTKGIKISQTVNTHEGKEKQSTDSPINECFVKEPINKSSCDDIKINHLLSLKIAQFCELLLELVKLYSLSVVNDMQKLKRNENECKKMEDDLQSHLTKSPQEKSILKTK